MFVGSRGSEQVQKQLDSVSRWFINQRTRWVGSWGNSVDIREARRRCVILEARAFANFQGDAKDRGYEDQWEGIDRGPSWPVFTAVHAHTANNHQTTSQEIL